MDIMVRVAGRYKYLIILIILFIFYNSFFLNKAFHIDDVFTIAIAIAVNNNFLNPPPVFFDNPILLGYYYAPIIRLFGEKEIWLHIFYLPFSLLVIISMYFLSRRFAGKSLLPVLFLICTPAFIVTSQSVMLDIPFLGLFLASIALFIYGVDRSNYRLLVLSAISIAAAILTKYSGLMLIPLLFVYSLIHTKKRYSLFLLIPVFIFFLWIARNIVTYKTFMFFDAALIQFRTYFINNLLIRIFALLSFLSGTSIIALFLSLYLLRNKVNIILFLLSLPIGLCPFLMTSFSEYASSEKFILAFFLAFSLFIILIVFKMGLVSLFNRGYNKDKLFLSLWFFILLGFVVLSNFIAARFVLLLFPPMFLLIYGQIFSDFEPSMAKIKKMFIFLILITLFLSTALAVGDYRFAGIYRDIGQYVKSSTPKESEVYFYLGEWGYDYYMIREGYRILTSNEVRRTLDYKYYKYRIPEGYRILTCEDIIRGKLHQGEDVIFIIPKGAVLPTVAFGRIENFLNELSRLECKLVSIDRRTYYGNIFLHNIKFHAGFYSHDWGLLPFSLFLKKAMMEHFDICQLIYVG